MFIADTLSRSVAQLDTVFKKLNSFWDPLTVDLFATRTSKQLPRYFSWKPDPQAEAIDAFAQDHRGYANPSWSLIGRCIQHIKNQKATVVLVRNSLMDVSALVRSSYHCAEINRDFSGFVGECV